MSENNVVTSLDILNLLQQGRKLTRGQLNQIAQSKQQTSPAQAEPSKKQEKEKKKQKKKAPEQLEEKIEKIEKKIKLIRRIRQIDRERWGSQNLLFRNYTTQMDPKLLEGMLLLNQETKQLLQIQSIIDIENTFHFQCTSLDGQALQVDCNQSCLLLIRDIKFCKLDDKVIPAFMLNCLTNERFTTSQHYLQHLNLNESNANSILVYLFGKNQFAQVNEKQLFEDISDDETFDYFNDLGEDNDQYNQLNKVIELHNAYLIEHEQIPVSVKSHDLKDQLVKFIVSSNQWEYGVVLRTLSYSNSQTRLLVRFLGEQPTTAWITVPYNKRMVVCSSIPRVPEENLKFLVQTDYMSFKSSSEAEGFIGSQLLRGFFSAMGEWRSNTAFFGQKFDSGRERDVGKVMRCRLCRYILSVFAYRACVVCGEKAHEYCLEKGREKCGSVEDGRWICDGCIACSICHCLRPREEIAKCLECGERFHRQCGFPSDKYCSRCIKCEWCKRTLTYVPDDSALLCEQCSSVKAKKEYCLICKAVWVNNDAEWERKYIQCDSPKCQMWIHNECDPLLSSDPEIFREYNSDESQCYRCPHCRAQIREGVFKDIIRFLSYFDVDKNYWQVDPLNTKYFEVIKKPMDFVTIYEKSYRNFDELVDDVTLLMKNCLQYNLPNSKIYRRTLQTEKIFGLLMPMLRPFAEMAEIQVMKYSERECGLVTQIPSLMGHLSQCFLDEAFRGGNTNTGTSSLVTLKSDGEWDGAWERQPLSFSSAVTMNLPDRLLVKWEQTSQQVPGQFENENEPLIKFSFREFAKHLLQQSITATIPAITTLINHSRVVAHPFLDLKVFQYDVMELEQTPVSFDEKAEDLRESNEMDLLLSRLLRKDISKCSRATALMMRVPHERIACELICSLCGGYEHSCNLLHCCRCKDTFHFFCQMKTAHLLPLRVISMLFADLQGRYECSRCNVCAICRKPPMQVQSVRNDLWCHNCAGYYHFKCVFPDFVMQPELFEFWRCPKCFQCALCKTKSLIDEQRLTQIRPSTTSNTLHISLEYLQNFLFCLSCGLIETGKRFCDYCEKYIPQDVDRELVLQITGPNALAQFRDLATQRNLTPHSHAVYFHYFQQLETQSNDTFNSHPSKLATCNEAMYSEPTCRT